MNKPANFKKLKDSFLLYFFALLGAVFLFVGTSVPDSNEYSYLLRLRKIYDANYLANDVTFAPPLNEYWLYDHVFGLLTFVFSLEFIGWSGRIICWSVLLYALMRLGKRWEIPVWLIALSIFLWLFVGQSFIADEWMFGDFEAKCVAYICLIFALERLCDKQDILSAILLGLTFAIHPVIGLWGIGAAIPALLIVHRNFLQTVKVTSIAGLISLIGVVPLLQMRFQSVPPTIENLKYFELVKFPHHFDPFSWSRSAILLVFLMMFFCAAIQFQNRSSKPLKFLFTFLSALGIFFVFGLLLRVLNQYELMEYTPTRLFAVFIPLFFLYYLSRAYRQNLLRKPLQIALLLPIMILAVWNNLPKRGFEQVKTAYESRNHQPDNLAETFVWLKNNTPPDALVIAPPWRYDFWYLSERAEVVNYRKPIIVNIGEWQNRLDKLIGQADPNKGSREESELKEFYFALSKEAVDAVADQYKADYFISETDYPYPVVYQKGNVKVYRFTKNA